jgi:uncharacterized iron-regulated protein
MSHPSRFLVPLAALGLLLLAACVPAGPQLIGDPQNPYPPAKPPKVGDIIHLPTGTPVTIDQLLDVAGDARVVYFGETHDNPASHRMEATLLDGLEKRRPGQMALGLEMFSRSQQPILDRWVAGELSEKEFLRQAHWYEQWNMNFAYYRELLNLAREQKIPVIALNAEKSLVRDIRSKPVVELSAEERSKIPALDLTDPYQRAQTLAILGDHSHDGFSAAGFLRAQTLWDETMAESIANYLASPQGTNRHLLICAGGDHVRFGFGIPRRAFRRLPASYLLVGGQEINLPPDKKDRLMQVEIPEFPMVPYDFLAYMDYEDLPERTVLIGIMFEPVKDGKGLLVKAVQPESNGERAGLKKGDILLQMDGMVLKESFDLIYAVHQKHPGDQGLFQVLRDGKQLDIRVDFRPGTSHHGG